MQQGPFVIPAFRPFIPRKLQPWIYVVMAFTFQFSGCRYTAALAEMMGSQSLMREDLQMCLYANMAGMALVFPLLFRLKFRFTNKTLLLTASTVILLCNWVAPHVTNLPLLWAICLFDGFFKLVGTFECLSTLQLWMTPKRDFRVFFPVLHLFIFGGMYLQDFVSSYLAELGAWELMNYLVCGVMMVNLLILVTCTRHFRFMRKFPLVGIDWSGLALWMALLLQLTYLLTYGDFYDWWNSPTVRVLTATTLVTLGAALWRQYTVRHPYISPVIWRMRYVKPILVLITVVEALFGTEYVLEEVFLEAGLHYGTWTGAFYDGYLVLGIIAGCLFALWWMKVMGWSYVRLIIVGLLALLGYLYGMYLLVNPEISREQLFWPLLLRGFAMAVLGSTFLTSLHDAMDFQTFFQGLAMFQSLHLIVGGVLGSAIYTHFLRYYIKEGFARYGQCIDAVSFSAHPFQLGEFMEHFAEQVQLISVRQIYGWVCYACIAFIFVFLLYDAPARKDLKKMPSWKSVGEKMRRPFVKG
jgi:hypothetical protein